MFLLLVVQVPYFLFIIFTVYTMLPFQLWDAVVLSVLTSLSHILVLTLNFTIFTVPAPGVPCPGTPGTPRRDLALQVSLDKVHNKSPDSRVFICHIHTSIQ